MAKNSRSHRRSAGPAETSGTARPGADHIRERLLRERQAAVAELARLGSTAETDGPTGTGDSPFEESDVAQASERLDMSLVQRERVAERINRFTRALERLVHGTYGVCQVCGRTIEAARLEVLPEASVCHECQQQLEQDRAAA